MGRIGVRLRVGEMAVGATALLRIASSARDEPESEHQPKRSFRQLRSPLDLERLLHQQHGTFGENTDLVAQGPESLSRALSVDTVGADNDEVGAELSRFIEDGASS